MTATAQTKEMETNVRVVEASRASRLHASLRKLFERGVTDRERLLRWSLAFAFASGFYLSRRLWTTSERFYPVSPAFDFLPGVPYPLDYVWFGIIVALIPAFAFARRPRKYLAAFVVLAALLALWDQARWQPWFYQYLFMAAPLAVFARGEPALNTCRVVIAGLYFWGGIQKLNYNFLAENATYLTSPFVRGFPAQGSAAAIGADLFMALIEVFIGMGLLTKKYRNVAAVLAVLMHVIILALIIPTRRNSVVWPWNVAMILFAFVLFWKTSDVSFREVIWNGGRAAHMTVVLLFCLMPALSFVDRWDSFPSFTLFSRNTVQATVYLTEPVARLLPARAQTIVRVREDGTRQLNVNSWSFAELNVPAYPEARVYLNIARRLCAHAEKPTDVLLELHERPRLLDGVRRIRTLRCDEL